jgi:hypothetical protein
MIVRGDRVADAALGSTVDALKPDRRTTFDGRAAPGPLFSFLRSDELNSRAIFTPRGGQWHSTSVVRLLERYGSVLIIA